MLDRLLPVIMYEQDLPALPITTAIPTLHQLLEEAAGDHGFEVLAVRSASRPRDLVRARQDFYYRAAARTLKSYPQIGRFIGRDHTTILHGIAMHCERYDLPFPRSRSVHFTGRRPSRSTP